MTPDEHNQVSKAPLISNQPVPKHGNNALMLFILVCLIAAVTGTTLLWINARKAKVDDYNTQWPGDMPTYDARTTDAEYDAAVARMQTLADAMNAYRDGRMGDGVRWPASIEDLQMMQLLDADFDATGLLSGHRLVLRPEMPVNHNPERWVICHDVELGWHRSPQGFRVKGPTAAVVILADGSVKLLKGDDLQLYGGLNLMVNAE